MADLSIRDALAGKAPVNSTVTIKGWVRTRRDSKGDFSFLAIHDGSCFDAVQVVAPNGLANYGTEISHLGAGCSVISRGTVVPSQGKGQAFEIQAAEVTVVGWVDDPESNHGVLLVACNPSNVSTRHVFTAATLNLDVAE